MLYLPLALGHKLSPCDWNIISQALRVNFLYGELVRMHCMPKHMCFHIQYILTLTHRPDKSQRRQCMVTIIQGLSDKASTHMCQATGAASACIVSNQQQCKPGPVWISLYSYLVLCISIHLALTFLAYIEWVYDCTLNCPFMVQTPFLWESGSLTPAGLCFIGLHSIFRCLNGF